MLSVTVGLLQVLGADVTLILGVRPFVVGVGVGHVGLEVGLFVEALTAQFALVLFLGLAHLFRVDVTDVSSFGRLRKRLRERAFSTPAIPSFNLSFKQAQSLPHQLYL